MRVKKDELVRATKGVMRYRLPHNEACKNCIHSESVGIESIAQLLCNYSNLVRFEVDPFGLCNMFEQGRFADQTAQPTEEKP